VNSRAGKKTRIGNSLAVGIACATLAVACLFAAPATADAAGTPGATEEGGWRFMLAPYVWATALDGDLTIRNTKTEVDLSFKDIIEDADIGFLGHMEAKNGAWSLIGDVDWLKLSDSTTPILGKVDSDLTQTIVELLAAYEK
jgi:hypothetical protein